MKSAVDILERITSLRFELRLDGDNIGLYEPLGGTLPNNLFEDLKAHKPELLNLLRFMEEADGLLLESSQRLAHAWPPNFDLDGDPRWQQVEQDLHAAYWSLDADKLKTVLDQRERLALGMFSAYRKGAAA